MLEHLFILYVHFGKNRSPLYNVPKQVHNLTWIWIHCGEKSLLMGNQFVVRQEDSNTHLTPRTRGKTIALCMDKVTPLAFKRQFLMTHIVLRVLVSCTFCNANFSDPINQYILVFLWRSKTFINRHIHDCHLLPTQFIVCKFYLSWL